MAAFGVCGQCGQILLCKTCAAKKGKCLDCGKPVTKPGTRCHRCQGKINYAKYLKPAPALQINWPSVDELEQRICVAGQTETARWLGISRTALLSNFKRLKAEELDRWLSTKVQGAGADLVSEANSLQSVKDSENALRIIYKM